MASSFLDSVAISSTITRNINTESTCNPTRHGQMAVTTIDGTSKTRPSRSTGIRYHETSDYFLDSSLNILCFYHAHLRHEV
ncbi:hypothetical protein RAB80_005076 [Fusarium oxysporum f. sp. vasinfectum]|uniref:Uncharacterized protein n=1 Tax=Fusarium oxysporum f. sp. cepae TaxID=396571 RepID=A0A3L6NWS1_FUSOX|nr:hypothetical protein FOMA001_g2762 [Fusarium oxysporum f. sp. matthiolae]KAJ0151519.1 putative fungistatic metabolite [Fusarium oxysporum f. sp. albedinis]KAK2679895.1 hypothetical protein RAB80_005076 [Fusarium oxysporum f. sp. vasinfectum]KAK2700754.1 hypothetical protein QWA68_000283 [Fusarium oxysporum]RKK22998.1 hypothetical protein BFJ65_g5579 [Fusarium oxysporum f. sp. cepae]